MRIHDGQNIFDVVLQNFGTLENCFDFISDNDLEFNSKLKAGQRISTLTDNKGEEQVKNFYQRSNFVLNNDQGTPTVGRAYSSAYSEGYS